MIIYEQEDKFIMIEQHTHANASGEMAKHWNMKYFQNNNKWNNVLLAVYEHDRGWIELDAVPFWNDREQVPYSFMDFPLPPKLRAYQYGIDQVEEKNSYAGLLCSLQYTNLISEISDPKAVNFLANEQIRQEKMIEQLIKNEDQKSDLYFHLNFLQFFDELSLYICLNEPGTKKENEHLWFRDGFTKSKNFPFMNGESIIAHWIDELHVKLSRFPFVNDFEINMKIKRVMKQHISQEGIAKAYEDTPYDTRTIIFIK
ncbi:DUF3891 family protein [Chengkuizengella sediminis]|uniref:DUF3891 family protein n=1 Tax=Chengkuizengella sediminis TaxID=1885917 RepID=UPI0013898585|nr:DUF3891 family protein [Chengkuizengella sediminis]NDI34425.1 DUF3891 family protein [Chengkuizengella sediminis]